MFARLSPTARWLLYALAFIVMLKALWNLGWLMVGELTFPTYGYGDHALFLAMGRAILNGLTPYVDLFENKPLGVFFVSALSLWWNDGITVARIVQSIVLLAIPVVAAITTLGLTQSESRREQGIIVGIATVFAIAITLFVGLHAGRLYTESFGALFGVGYAAMLILTRTRTYRLRHFLLSALCIGGALGFKEQFLFSLLATAVLLCPRWRDVLYRFVFPLAIACTVGVVVLWLLGFLEAYVTVYLRYLLLEHHLVISIPEPRHPLPLYGLALLSYGKGLIGSVPLLAGLVGLLWVTLFASPPGTPSCSRWQQWITVAIALYLTMLSAQMAGTKGHHQVVAAPVYFAAFFLIVQTMSMWNDVRRVRVLVTAFLLTLATSTLLFPTSSYSAALVKGREQDSYIRDVAATIDTVLDRCDLERYGRISVSEQEYAYTNHTPLPTGLMQHTLRQKTGVPLFNAQIRESLTTAEVLLVRNGDWQTPEVVMYLQDYFTPKAPPCAGTYNLPEHLVLVFRKLPHGAVRR